MKFEIVAASEIGTRVADLLAEQLKQKPDSVLGMTTGSSPIKYGIFQEWIRREAEGGLDFAEATFTNPDEWVGIDAEHPESFAAFMQEHLFSQLKTKRKPSHIPNGAAENLLEECGRFDQLLRELGYVDWQLMGLGLNGHIAFIEPADAIPASTYVANIEVDNQLTRSSHFRTPQEVPKQSITIGLEAVMKARSIVLVAAGDNKAEIVEAAFRGPITTRVPATLLQLHPNVTVILDEGSAKRISI
ncbi:glucosamine-6-phosphate deaminase [Paenibacillus silvisoli]|uniref:glucosamine-6-phosphate deaminase n=1 Tax=Paenibacillus silvisoli TaxID=3110539 RepID=UPI002804673E|nr:glucosamine-6-phosphate deaminase [Paenibacillus silvisoli]